MGLDVCSSFQATSTWQLKVGGHHFRLVAYPVVTFIPIAGRGSSKAFQELENLRARGIIYSGMSHK